MRGHTEARSRGGCPVPPYALMLGLGPNAIVLSDSLCLLGVGAASGLYGSGGSAAFRSASTIARPTRVAFLEIHRLDLSLILEVRGDRSSPYEPGNWLASGFLLTW